MLAFLSGLFRRLLGGWLSKVPLIKERAVQWILCALLYAPTIYFIDYNTRLHDFLPHWIFVTLSTLLLIIAETKGHFPGFKCGTESLDYINEQKSKGRSIDYESFVNWLAEKRGVEKYGREWCFYQLVLCKTIWLIPVSLLLGSQFIFIGVCVAFAYNAAFWIGFKDFKNILTSPTNWGEFFQGVLYMYGILLGGL